MTLRNSGKNIDQWIFLSVCLCTYFIETAIHLFTAMFFATYMLLFLFLVIITLSCLNSLSSTIERAIFILKLATVCTHVLVLCTIMYLNLYQALFVLNGILFQHKFYSLWIKTKLTH